MENDAQSTKFSPDKWLKVYLIKHVKVEKVVSQKLLSRVRRTLGLLSRSHSMSSSPPNTASLSVSVSRLLASCPASLAQRPHQAVDLLFVWSYRTGHRCRLPQSGIHREPQLYLPRVHSLLVGRFTGLLHDGIILLLIIRHLLLLLSNFLVHFHLRSQIHYHRSRYLS